MNARPTILKLVARAASRYNPPTDLTNAAERHANMPDKEENP